MKHISPHYNKPIWSGSRLSTLRNSQEKYLGESLEVSILEGQSALLDGVPMSQLYSARELPYILKLIDTLDLLSVQVHPTTAYFKKHPLAPPKTECWLILDAEAESKIYLGFKAGVTKEHYLAALQDGRPIAELLNSYSPKRGDFFFVPAGSVHAIGKNIFLAEVQQLSGTTFRVDDWGRVDSKGQSRELHLKEALESLTFGDEFNCDSYFKLAHGLLDRHERVRLCSEADFNVEIVWPNDRLEVGSGRLSTLHSLETFTTEILPMGTTYIVQKSGPSLYIF